MVLIILYVTIPGMPSRASQKSGAMTPSLRFSASVSSAAVRTSCAESCDVSRPTMRATCARPSSRLRSVARKVSRTSRMSVVPARQKKMSSASTIISGQVISHEQVAMRSHAGIHPPPWLISGRSAVAPRLTEAKWIACSRACVATQVRRMRAMESSAPFAMR